MKGNLETKYRTLYKTLYKEIEIMINNIKEIGIDVSQYEELLKKIDNNIPNDIDIDVDDINEGIHLEFNSHEQDYITGIGNLTELKDYLNKYNCYFKAFNSCKWIELATKDKDITNKELESYVNEMILNLNSINESDTIDDKINIVESIYKIAYDLIKLELIMMNGKSELYLYIVNQEINILAYFDKLMRDEINKLKQTSDKDIDSIIKEKIYEKRKDGINATIFDIEIIKSLLANQNNTALKERIIDNINNNYNDIKDNLNKIDELTTSIKRDKNTKNQKKDRVKTLRKSIFKKIISLALTVSFMAGGAIGIEKLGRKFSKDDIYTKKTETYSSINDCTDTELEKIDWKSDDEVVIRVYDKYEGNDKRHYQEYEVTKTKFDNLEDYYNYGVENYGVVPEEKYTDKVSNYQDNYVEVQRTTYEYLSREIDLFTYVFLLAMGYVGYILCISMIESIYYDENYKLLITGKIKEILRIYSTYQENNKDRRKLNNDLKEKINELMNLINENEQLRNEFYELYKNNIYLLNDREELINKINELNEDERLKEARILVKTKM